LKAAEALLATVTRLHLSYKSDPKKHLHEAEYALKTLTGGLDSIEKRNFERFGHPAGLHPGAIEPFTVSEVDALLKYMDPNADGRLDFEEVDVGMRRAHSDPDLLLKEQRAGDIMMRLEAQMHDRNGMSSVRKLFDKLDEDGSGEITIPELRRGLQALNQASVEKRFREKKKAVDLELESVSQSTSTTGSPLIRGTSKHKELEKAAQKAAAEKEVKKRLQVARENGAYDALLKLEQVMRVKVMSVEGIFKMLDKDGDGDIDVDEFVDGLINFKSVVTFNKAETRALIDFFDENGDGSIEPDEFETVLKRLRKEIRRSTRADDSSASTSKSDL